MFIPPFEPLRAIPPLKGAGGMFFRHSRNLLRQPQHPPAPLQRGNVRSWAKLGATLQRYRREIEGKSKEKQRTFRGFLRYKYGQQRRGVLNDRQATRRTGSDGTAQGAERWAN
jgi:hypothetical protein